MQSVKYLITIGLIISSVSAEFPSHIERCKPHDNKCMEKVATHIIQTYPNGEENFGLPKIEPHHVKTFTIGTNSGGSVSLKLVFNDIDIIGLSKGTVDKIGGFGEDPETSKFEGSVLVPVLKLKGKYEADGQILILPIQGKGDVELILENCRMSMKMKPTVIKKDGKSYLEITKLKAFTEISRLRTQLDNLFNGDKILGDNMNTFLNENWKDVWDEVSPSVNKVIEGIFASMIKPIFNKFSYDDLLLKD